MVSQLPLNKPFPSGVNVKFITTVLCAFTLLNKWAVRALSLPEKLQRTAHQASGLRAEGSRTNIFIERTVKISRPPPHMFHSRTALSLEQETSILWREET